MGNTIQTFTNDAFGVIRTITNDGQTLFCGKDVATVLGYTNTKDALTRHCKGFVNHYPLQTICVCGGRRGDAPEVGFASRTRTCAQTLKSLTGAKMFTVP